MSATAEKDIAPRGHHFTELDREKARAARMAKLDGGWTPQGARKIAQRYSPRAIRHLYELMRGKGAGTKQEVTKEGDIITVERDVPAFTQVAAARELLLLAGAYPPKEHRVTIDDAAAQEALSRDRLSPETQALLSQVWESIARDLQRPADVIDVEPIAPIMLAEGEDGPGEATDEDE